MTDIFTNEELGDKALEMWDQGYKIGEIITELGTDANDTIEFFHYQGLI